MLADLISLFFLDEQTDNCKALFAHWLWTGKHQHSVTQKEDTTLNHGLTLSFIITILSQIPPGCEHVIMVIKATTVKEAGLTMAHTKNLDEAPESRVRITQ